VPGAPRLRGGSPPRWGGLTTHCIIPASALVGEAVSRATGWTAAEDVMPVIAQAPIPPGAHTLERPVESGAEGARSTPYASKLSGKRTEGRPTCGTARHQSDVQS